MTAEQTYGSRGGVAALGAHDIRGGVRGGRVVAGALEAGRTIGAGLDGLVLGLIAGCVVASFASGPGLFLGLPWPFEVLIRGAGVVLLVGAGAGMGRFVVGMIRSATRGLGRALARAPRRVRAIALAPGRFAGGLPGGLLGGVGVLIWLGAAGWQLGVLGLFAPSGMLTPYIYAAGLIGALLALAAHLVRRRAHGPLGRAREGLAAVAASAALLLAVAGAGLVTSPGDTASLVPADARFDGTASAATPLPDPGLPGTYAVDALSYGSGTDARRPAYGASVALTTQPVDASRLLHRLGWGADEAREWFWGFGTDELPLNALVWQPVGDGPFPLVLMVHGNHAMGAFSEPGYEYLGRHLASRGYIAASIDENFLNGSWASDWQGTEQVVRAWLLLLHLDQFRAWNATPGNPFHERVDMGRVALVGHSRGGEAASLAASLTDRATAPTPALAPWPTGLAVRSVVAIAPSDGQYGGTVTLKGVDLLELAGGYDSDARGWMGLRQYARTTVVEDGFKAAFWSYRSNHGQFNTVWGRSDHGPLGGALLNLAPVLDPAAQEDVARTVIGAFLEASLNDVDGYRGLFRRPMTGREWLPRDDIFLVRSGDARFEPLTTGNPGATLSGIEASFDGFDAHRARSIPMRALLPDQGMMGLELRWSAAPTGAPAAWGLTGLAARARDVGARELRLSLANGTDVGPEAAPLDPLIELTTTDGVVVALPLSRWGSLPPPLVVSIAKGDLLAQLAGGLDVASPVERVLQTYAIPFADFEAADPAFRGDDVASFRILFDRASPGAAWVAEVGLSGA